MDNTQFSRRQLVLTAGAGIARLAYGQENALTAKIIVERIQKNVGIPWRETTVDV
jgi:hypothetical protein